MSVFAPWNSAFYYSPGEIVEYNAADYRATSEQPNQNEVPDVVGSAFWTVYQNGGQNVVSAINAGNGITVADGQTADPTISLNLLAGLGTSVQNSGPGTSATVSVVIDAGDGIDITAVAGPGGGVGDTVVVSNLGVITATAGSGLSNTGTATNPVFINTGVLSAGTGTGIGNTNTATDPIFVNTGVISLTASSGCANIGSAQDPNITNTGVLSVGANTGLISSGGQNPIIGQSSATTTVNANAANNTATPTSWGGNNSNAFTTNDVSRIAIVNSTPLTGGTDCIIQVLIDGSNTGLYNLPSLLIRNNNGSAGTNNNQSYYIFLKTTTGAIVNITSVQLSPNESISAWIYGGANDNTGPYMLNLWKNYISLMGSWSPYNGNNMIT
jgi:hypothetical protein